MAFLIPTRKQWQNWSLPSKATYLGFVIAVATAVIALLPNIPIRPSLSAELAEGGTATIILENNGDMEVQISASDTEIFHTCLFDAGEFQIGDQTIVMEQWEDFVNFNNIAQLEDINGIVLSPGTSLTRLAFKIPKQEDFFCAFDVVFSLEYHPTSAIGRALFDAAELTNLSDLSTEIIIRFDGCQYSRIGRKALDARTTGIQRFIITDQLINCVRKIRPDFPETTGISGALESAIEEELEKYNEEELIGFSLYILHQIEEATGPDLQRMCIAWTIVYKILRERTSFQLGEPYPGDNQYLLDCIGFDGGEIWGSQ